VTRILATAELASEGLDELSKLAEVNYQPRTITKRLLAGVKLVEVLAGHEVFVTEADQIKGQAVFDKLPELRLIGACRGEPVNVDVETATARGIPVLNTPGRNAVSVAELSIAFMLSLARHSPETAAVLKSGEGGSMRMVRAYTEFQGNELLGKTVGLVGLGAVGAEVAKRATAFGCRVVAFDPYVSARRASELGVEMVSLDRLMREADFVSIHAAVTPETTGLIGAPQFTLMKPTAYFINTARAALTDEEALTSALSERRIAGAALDVFGKEPPPPNHPLLALPNVLATPHIGGNTAEIAAHHTAIIVDDLVRWLGGKRPRHCVNPETVKDLAP
jgi:autoinducer 2 (AI-2) kinase